MTECVLLQMINALSYGNRVVCYSRSLQWVHTVMGGLLSLDVFHLCFSCKFELLQRLPYCPKNRLWIQEGMCLLACSQASNLLQHAQVKGIAVGIVLIFKKACSCNVNTLLWRSTNNLVDSYISRSAKEADRGYVYVSSTHIVPEVHEIFRVNQLDHHSIGSTRVLKVKTIQSAACQTNQAD